MEKIVITVKTSPRYSIKSCLAENKHHLIHELKVIGPYQAEYDNDIVRKMCNIINQNGLRSGGQLEILDLSDAEIMTKQDGFHKDNLGHIWSTNSLHGCLTLRIIRFGKSLTNISGKDLSGCISLEKIEVKDNLIYKSINGILYQYADNCNWQSSQRTIFRQGEWILIKVPPAIQDSSLIEFDKINRIAPYAFNDTLLKSLKMPSIPPVCDIEAFAKEIIPNITLFVPENSFNNYWAHNYWGQFIIKTIPEK